MACFLILTKGDYGQLEISAENFYAFAIHTSFGVSLAQLNWEIKQAGIGYYVVTPEELEDRIGKNTLGWEEEFRIRGANYEEYEGANIGGTFKTIDDFDWDDGTATSVKTINLTSESYQNIPNLVKSTIFRYIDKLKKFDGHKRMVEGRLVVVEDGATKFRILDVAIPAKVLTDDHLRALNDAYNHANSVEVTLIIKEVP